MIEALHHFPNYAKALGEIHRVLKPGGSFYAYEPNALSPLRRLSEVRDRLRGTVEKSFYQGQATRLCLAAGFEMVQVRAVPGGRSSWKLVEVPLYRRPVARFHGWLQQKLPRMFGPLIITARKAGRLQDEPARPEAWKSRLRSPTSGLPLAFDPDSKRWCEVNGRHSFSRLQWDTGAGQGKRDEYFLKKAVSEGQRAKAGINCYTQRHRSLRRVGARGLQGVAGLVLPRGATSGVT